MKVIYLQPSQGDQAIRKKKTGGNTFRYVLSKDTVKFSQEQKPPEDNTLARKWKRYIENLPDDLAVGMGVALCYLIVHAICPPAILITWPLMLAVVSGALIGGFINRFIRTK